MQITIFVCILHDKFDYSRYQLFVIYQVYEMFIAIANLLQSTQLTQICYILSSCLIRNLRVTVLFNFKLDKSILFAH